MTLLAILIYIPLQIVLLPLGIIGAAWTGYKQIIVSQRLGLSQTAIEIINGRWTMDVFGMREDKAARRLSRKLPNTSIFGLWLALLPLYILYRISGKNLFYPRSAKPGYETIADLVMARTPHFDAIINQHIASARQFVVLGAGLDTRAYGLMKDEELAIFELDQPATQQMKRKCLKRARIASDHVTFVEVDFESGDWTKDLVEAGFDPSLKTIFLWEGVTLYLSREDVVKTLRSIRSLSSPGSTLIADIYGDRMIKFSNNKVLGKTLEATNETLGFGLDFSKNPHNTLETFVSEQEMNLQAAKFLGDKTRKGAYAVVAEIDLNP